jgi:hypothetical protein
VRLMVPGRFRSGAVSVCVVAGALVLSASALAVAPEPPEAKPATGVTATAATLHGVLNPKVSATAGWYFTYGTELLCALGTTTPVQPQVTGKALPEHFELSGLEPSRTYTACMVAVNEASEATTSLNEVTFKTLASKPTIDSESVTTASSTAATLEAQVNPNNQETTFTLEYSTKATSGKLEGTVITVNGETALPAGFGDQPATVSTGALLQPGTVYFYRVTATNATGTTAGVVDSFTTVPAPATDPPSPLAATTATLNAHLTLDAADTTYSFIYAPGAECTAEGAISTASADAGTGSAQASESTAVTGLTPHTEYSVCFVTANPFGTQQGPGVTFTTPAAVPTITEQHTTEVTGSSAVLGAQVDPGGAETTYLFEYGTGGAYTHMTPVSAPLPPDNAAHPAAAQIEGLAAGTEYNYRLEASNESGVEHGPEGTFTTQPANSLLGLPDGRQYQLVSPPEKDGAQVYGIVAENGVVIAGTGAVQASENGDAITYLASAPLGANPPGNSSASQILSTRAGTGWGSKTISAAHENPVGNLPLGIGEPYRLFSSDLSLGVFQEFFSSPISLRDDSSGFSHELTGPELPPPPVEFQAATPDLTHIILNSGPVGTSGLYEYTAGTLAQVNILESEEPAPGSYLGGYRVTGGERGNSPSEFAGRHAVSDDGSRVVWGDATSLYSRDLATAQTVQLDAAQGGTGSGGGVFQLASSDGTRVFFTDQETLTPGAVPNSLYMFDIPKGRLRDLGPVGILYAIDPSRPPGRGDEVLGANEAGTTVYVGSESALSEQPNAAGEIPAAGAGARNLFLLREAPGGGGSWTASFIATLSQSDMAGYNPNPSGSSPKHLAHAPVRVSPDGGYLAFMSNRSLPFRTAHGLRSYDNRDARSAMPDEEVFLYDAATEGLVCASCDPSGARPVGVLDTGAYPGLAADPAKTWGESTQEAEEPGVSGHWLAASIPGWNEAIHNSFTYNTFETPLYEPRLLSNTGRLFFNSRAALLPQDTNGHDDVYQYEPAGSGSCPAGQSGCVALISSGRGGGDSDFVDASANGNDVFFTTADRLVAADRDGAADMYDAHICAPAAPCLTPSAESSPPCTSTDDCRAAQAIQPGVFGPSGTATLSGAENLKPAPAPKPTAAQLRAKALAKALKACRRKGAHRKRTACERQARRRYGPRTAARKTAAPAHVAAGGRSR